MKIILAFCLICLLSLCTASADDTSADNTSADFTAELSERLGRVPATHPRLFFTDAETAGVKARIGTDPLLSAAYDHLISAADLLIEQEPVKHEVQGRRLLSVSRACLQRVSYLAFAHRMTGDDRYLDRARREMLAAAAFTDWNPSHFLDVAEMTAALAVGYDWLYNSLDADARAAIREAIIEKGLRTSLAGGWWVTTTNNWNQVCHGGLVLGALAVLEHEPDLARRIIARAIENLPRAMGEYEPDGVYPEGPSYWKYGTSYNVLVLSALESVLDTDFGLGSAESFMKTPEFYLQMTGPTGLYFNFADCGTRGAVTSAMHWFARKRQDQSLLWQEKQELELFAAAPPDRRGGGDRMLAFLFVWGRPLDELEPPQMLHWKGDGENPVAVLRTGWDKDATYLGIKGGSPSSNHAHMDAGSFVLDMKGVRWALDLGMQGYHGLESQGIDLWNRRQNSERWTIFRLNNFGHNTLVIDGQLQQVDGNAPITKFSDDKTRPFAVVDMTPVYDGQVARALRGARLEGKAALLQDEVTTLEKPANVRWAMITRAQAVLEDDRTAKLTQDGQSVLFRLLAPAGAKLAVESIETPPRDYDAPNPDTRMIVFEAQIPAATTETFAVFITPEDAAGAPAALEALDSW